MAATCGQRNYGRYMRKSVNDLVREAKARIEELSIEQLQDEIAAGSCTVIDIRDFRERLEKGAIPRAVSSPPDARILVRPGQSVLPRAVQVRQSIRAVLRRRAAVGTCRSGVERHRLHQRGAPRGWLQRLG